MEAPSVKKKQRMQEQTPLSSTMFGSKFNTVSRTTAYPAKITFSLMADSAAPHSAPPPPMHTQLLFNRL